MRERLYVVDERRLPEVAGLGRKGRAQAGHAAATLEGLEHRRLLAADVRARAGDDLHGHRTQQAGTAELCDRGEQPGAGRGVLLSQVDDRVLGLYEPRCDRHALDEQVRPQFHDVAVLDRARLAFVGVDDDDARPGVLDDGRPFAERREAGAAVAHEARRLDLRQHGVVRVLGPQRLEPATPFVVGECLVGLGETRGRPVVCRVRDGNLDEPRQDRVAAGPDRRKVAVAEARNLDHGDSLLARAPAPEQAGRGRRSSRRRGRCTRGRSHEAAGGTSRTTRPRPPLRGGCSCGPRARRKAPASPARGGDGSRRGCRAAACARAAVRR